MDIAAQILELETRAAFQDRTIEQLHEVVLDLQKQMDALNRSLDEIKEKVTRDTPDIGPSHEPPPHW